VESLSHLDRWFEEPAQGIDEDKRAFTHEREERLNGAYNGSYHRICGHHSG
jgi:hypothetical protein